MVHPAGLGGSPVTGQRSRAVVKASWTASSARSMSPQVRTSTATARPYSARNTRSIAAAETGVAIGSVVDDGLEGPDLDRQPGRAGKPSSPDQGGVEVDGRMMVKPPTCSLPSVNGPSVITTSPPVARRTVAVLGGMEPTSEHPRARGLELHVHGIHVRHDGVHLGHDLGRRRLVRLVDGQ